MNSQIQLICLIYKYPQYISEEDNETESEN